MLGKKKDKPGSQPSGKAAKAKKSINALILASGTLATPSFPSFFQTIKMHLRPRTKADSQPVVFNPTSISQHQHQQQQQQQQRGTNVQPLGANRRAHSMSVLATEKAVMDVGRSVPDGARGLPAPGRSGIADEIKAKPNVVGTETISNAETTHASNPSIPAAATSSDSPHNAPPSRMLAIAKSGDPPHPTPTTSDSDDLDFDAEFGFTDISTPTPLKFADPPMLLTPPLTPHPPLEMRTPKNPSQPKAADRKISPRRRIQSAPTASLALQDDSLLLDTNDEDDDWDEDRWFVASVKAKASRQLGSAAGRGGGMVGANDEEDEEKQGNLESWDADFDNTDADAETALRIPDTVRDLQSHLKSDAINLKKFALHIEDLKLLLNDALDISSALPARTLSHLQKPYAPTFARAHLLIALGSYADDGVDKLTPTDHDMSLLCEMLVTGPAGDKRGGDGRLSEEAERDVKRMMVGNGDVLQFGVELMPALMRHMGPVKEGLRRFVDEVRGEVVRGAGV
ncbi:uncharacterized protein EV422DRAFT_538984 [Fimicolochytrium jonesii]|uniref:uncharacterized protein n=1 Tax=Fimicolochytrium jonesii TaxID=1396493 RepID=UPI0022FDC2A1|nr:uncharacterized protein EV422DRAFT_538984 [Fimicolochytrium jonesii]KAI8818184.1 hypothetical protein EV422DRAFT_538984 [Fimicolochytrium jonesii]